MAEYIERESLLKQMEGYCSANCGHEHSEDPLCPSCFMNDAIILVEDWTAADVRPVEHGVWMKHKYRRRCNHCGCAGAKNWRYCPVCGRQMTVED